MEMAEIRHFIGAIVPIVPCFQDSFSNFSNFSRGRGGYSGSCTIAPITRCVITTVSPSRTGYGSVSTVAILRIMVSTHAVCEAFKGDVCMPMQGSWYHKGYGGAKSPWMKIERVRAHLREAIAWHNELLLDDRPAITVEDVMGRTRVAYIVACRADVMRRLRLDCKWSYPRIGAFLQRDHTTVLFHCAPVRDLATWTDRRAWLEFTRVQEVAAFRSVARDVDEFEAELATRKTMREMALMRRELKRSERYLREQPHAAE